jgi:hypothetical protein
MVWSAGRLVMPTDLDAATVARKRKAQALPPIEITVLLVCAIIFLAMLVLLALDQSFSNAAIELFGRF